MYNIWYYDVTDEISYKSVLIRYLRKNPDKSEYDFVLGGVNEYKGWDKATIMNDKDFLKSLNKKDAPKYINDKNIELWQKEELRRYKISHDFNIRMYGNLLQDYRIRLNRLPKPEKEVKKNYSKPQQKKIANKTSLNRLFKLEKEFSEQNWFKVSLLFATGEIDQLFKEHESASSIAKAIYGEDWEGYRPYISSSQSKTSEHPRDNHNIYTSFKKMKKIIDYCKKRNIKVTDDFNNKYNKIKPIK